jgi:hypothetical protein
MSWPPTLEALKKDLGTAYKPIDDPADEQLQQVLGAAAAFVERVRPKFNYATDPLSEFPEPTADLELGTIRLAGRWHTRRRSPDGLVQMAELGSARIPSFDPDIDRLLGIGRYMGPVFA